MIQCQTFEISTDKEDIAESVFCFLSSTVTPLPSTQAPLSHSNVFDDFFAECWAGLFCGVFFESVLTCNFVPATQDARSINHKRRWKIVLSSAELLTIIKTTTKIKGLCL